MDVLAVLNEFSDVPIKAFPSRDIAVLNLVAAHGLPGFSEIDVDQLLGKLDEWAEQVKFEIRRHLYRFEDQANEEPTEYSYGNSLGRFFCWYMLQVLQEDCGVVYHPERKFDPDFCQPEDLFIHGIVGDEGKGGSCASMPVVYVAVARRLGFPVHLVSTKGHLFFRWDDPIGTTITWKNPDLSLWIPPDRFNVEGAGEGISYRPDSHYIQWPELWNENDFEHGCYLKNLSTEEEVAAFLVQRAECFHELGNWNECLKALHFARKLAPDDKRYDWLHARRSKQLDERNQSIEDMIEMNRQRIAKQKSQYSENGHPISCMCQLCKKLESRTIPPHGESCTCKHCSDAREAAVTPVGFPGHDARSCPCPTCSQGREKIQQPRTVGFAPTPTLLHMPQNFPTSYVPAIPNHQPHQPGRKNLPGF